MAHSSLATVSVPSDSSNYTRGRSTRIRCITIHHMAGVMSAEGCGRIFQRPGRNGSTHYGIGVNGEIGVYVEEENTAWANSSWASNCESVTIENSNSSTGGDWPVSDATLNSCIKLVADIAKRNGLGTLVPGQNLTWHSMFVATTCPGNYLRSRIQYIADEANKINNGGTPAPAPTPTPESISGDFKVGDKVSPKEYVDYNGTRLLKTRDYYFISSLSGNRAVLSADSATGPIYAAMNTNNLNKVGSVEPSPTPSTDGISVGDKVALKDYVDYNGTRLVKTRDFYYVWQLNGDRAVLTADSVGGTVYAAVKVGNLNKVGGNSQPTPAPAPSTGIGVGSKVTLTNWVDYNGTRLVKTRDFYYVSELNGNRAVLRADSMGGAVYAAVNTSNLRTI